MAAGGEEVRQRSALSAHQSVTSEVGELRGCGTPQGSRETSGCVVGRPPGPALMGGGDDLMEGVMGYQK